MATIAEFGRNFPKRVRKMAIYNALGEELTNELDSTGCELIIHDDLKSYEFTNITPELQSKIDAKKIK